MSINEQLLLAQHKQAYGAAYGISRTNFRRTAKGWWVRLGWKKNTPIFQKTVLDSKYGNDSLQSFSQACLIRDEAFFYLVKTATLPLSTRKLPHMTVRNKTGIPGVTLQYTKSKTGSGVYLSWKLNWKETKARGRTFAFSTYGSGLQAFKAAAIARMETDLRVYGFSDINSADNNLELLYHQAMLNYQQLNYPVS